jgi:hypothetical protein
LGLDISPEKSKIVNLIHNYSEFLGFKINVLKKGKGTHYKEPRDNYVVQIIAVQMADEYCPQACSISGIVLARSISASDMMTPALW